MGEGRVEPYTIWPHRVATLRRAASLSFRRMPPVLLAAALTLAVLVFAQTTAPAPAPVSASAPAPTPPIYAALLVQETVLTAPEGGSVAYTVTADDGAITLVRAGANSLSLNGGVVRDNNGIDAKLAHRAASQDASAANDAPAPGHRDT